MEPVLPFSATFGEAWAIPSTVSDTSSDPQPFLRLPLPGCLPQLLDYAREVEWGGQGKWLWVQTDNQLLEQEFDGLAQVSDDLTKASCVQIGRHMEHLLLGGMDLKAGEWESLTSAICTLSATIGAEHFLNERFLF